MSKQYKVYLSFSESLYDEGFENFTKMSFSYSEECIKELSMENIAYLLARNEVLACGHLPNMDTHQSLVRDSGGKIYWNDYSDEELLKVIEETDNGSD